MSETPKIDDLDRVLRRRLAVAAGWDADVNGLNEGSFLYAEDVEEPTEEEVEGEFLRLESRDVVSEIINNVVRDIFGDTFVDGLGSIMSTPAMSPSQYGPLLASAHQEINRIIRERAKVAVARAVGDTDDITESNNIPPFPDGPGRANFLSKLGEILDELLPLGDAYYPGEQGDALLGAGTWGKFIDEVLRLLVAPKTSERLGQLD